MPTFKKILGLFRAKKSGLGPEFVLIHLITETTDVIRSLVTHVPKMLKQEHDFFELQQYFFRRSLFLCRFAFCGS